MVNQLSVVQHDFSVRPDSLFNGYDNLRHSIDGSGRLVVTPPGSTAGYWILASKLEYDCSNGGGLSIRCDQTLNAGNGSPETGLQIKIDINNYIYIVKSGSLLRFREKLSGGNNDTSVTYDPVAHRYWRVRGKGNVAYWDTSPDGGNWINQRTKTTLLDLSSMSIEIIVGTLDGGTASIGAAIFDDLNMPHPRSFMAFL